MNKFLNYILIFLVCFLFSCSYKPVLNQETYKFSLNLEDVNGDNQINSILINKFNSLKNNKNNYDLSLFSSKEKKTISKDSKGDPAIFELLIVVKYTVKSNGKIVLEKNISKISSYNNISDKFELENYEKTIIKNLSKGISENIISSISELNEW